MSESPPWPQAVIEQVARVLGDTTTGLSGSQIRQLLGELKMNDIDPENTKWKRLYNALLDSHNRHSGPRRIITFIAHAMAPVRYSADPASFSARQGSLNEALVHVGLRVTDEGKVAKGPRASTLSEAAQLANRLRSELRRRGTHPDVLLYCTQEILEQNPFHGSLEAAKSVADRLRKLSGNVQDGARLVDATLNAGQRSQPIVAINSYATPSEQDEQKGFANLCKGMFSMFRNPTAHRPRISSQVGEDELLEVMTIASMAHRRLDQSTVNP